MGKSKKRSHEKEEDFEKLLKKVQKLNEKVDRVKKEKEAAKDVDNVVNKENQDPPETNAPVSVTTQPDETITSEAEENQEIEESNPGDGVDEEMNQEWLNIVSYREISAYR